MDKDKVITHEFPARRDVSDYIVMVELEQKLGSKLEQLWVRKLSNDLFEMCCIPFFADGIALFDVVRVDGDSLIQEVFEKKGHTTLRIVFAEIDEWERVLAKVISFGGLVEVRWHQSNLVAVDAPDQEVVRTLVEYFDGLLGNVLLDFEYNTEIEGRV